MRRHVFSFAALAFVISTLVSPNAQAQTQTPEAAIDHFKTALKLSDRGEIDRAIEEYSKAIAISSRLDNPKKLVARNPVNSFTGLDDAVELSTENIRVIDPFTSHAYNNRGLLRYQQGDNLGAIEDFNAAVRIRPSLAAAYLNRAAAYRANGDSQSALQDLDRAIKLKKDFFQAYNNRGSLHHD